jgi:hypothetical protein
MGANRHGTIQLGDLVVAAFDEAAHHSSDPEEVSRLATAAVLKMLQSWRAARPVGAMQVPRNVTLSKHKRGQSTATSER